METPHLTWLDLLAANMGAMMWLWGVMAARHWLQTERKKFIPGFALVALVGLALLIFSARAGYWYEDIMTRPIVPEVVSR
jgi:hypothetical protein